MPPPKATGRPGGPPGPDSRVHKPRRRLLAGALLLTAALGALPAGGARRIEEKRVNLAVARQVAERLRAAGARVVMTRTSDRTVALPNRTGLANRRRTDVFVSIHYNCCSRTLERTDLYRQIRSTRSRRLAEHIATAYRRQIPGRDTSVRTRRGSRGDFYYQLRTTRMPAVIVEGAFLSNPGEARRLTTRTGQRQHASAIADGILHYAGMPLPPGPPPSLDPGTRTEVAHLPPPADAAARLAGPTAVRIGWTTHPAVLVYRVYRGSQLIGELDNPAFADPGGGAKLSFTDRWARPGERYRYYVMGAVPVKDPVQDTVLESEPSRFVVDVPMRRVRISVTLDPGHGGRDSGTAGRY